MWEYLYYKIYEVSSLTDNEYVAIIGNYHNSGNVDEDQVLRDRGYTEDQIKFVQKEKMPEGLVSLDVVFTGDNKVKYPYLSYILTLFSNYKLGNLPFAGPVTKQPAKILEMFGLLERLGYEAEERMRKQIEKENR